MQLRTIVAWLSVAFLVSIMAAGSALSAGDLLIASEGKARLPIVLPRVANEVEQAAAEELASYLERVTGARFKIKKEQASSAGVSAA